MAAGVEAYKGKIHLGQCNYVLCWQQWQHFVFKYYTSHGHCEQAMNWQFKGRKLKGFLEPCNIGKILLLSVRWVWLTQLCGGNMWYSYIFILDDECWPAYINLLLSLLGEYFTTLLSNQFCHCLWDRFHQFHVLFKQTFILVKTPYKV